MPSRGRPPPSPASVQQALSLHAGGVSNGEIARRLDVTESTIRRWLKTYQEAPPPLPEPAVGNGGQSSEALPARLRALASDLGEVGDTASAALCNEAAAALEAAPELPSLDAADTAASIRAMIARLMRSAEDNRSVENFVAAQRAMAEAAKLQTTLARVERQQGDKAGTVTLSLAEIEAAEAEVIRMDQAALSRGLVCERCNQDIALDWIGMTREQAGLD